MRKTATVIFVMSLVMLPVPGAVLAEDAPQENQHTNLNYEVQAKILYINNDIQITQMVSVGDKLIEPGHVNIEGYVFSGWFEGDRKWDFANDTVQDNLRLTAKYIKEENIWKIINTTDPSVNFLNANLDMVSKNIPVTQEEKNLLDSGETMGIKLIVKEKQKDDVNPLKKEMFTSAMKDEKEVAWIESILTKSIGGSSSNIDRTDGKQKITITIPEEFRKNNRVYTVYGEVEGKVVKLFEGKAGDGWMITFETSEFSIFTLAYIPEIPAITPPSEPKDDELIIPEVKPVTDTSATLNINNAGYVANNVSLIGLAIASYAISQKEKRKKITNSDKM